ncbi:unnamed protein product [Durusdinium trenchii]|uniref:Phosphopantetheine adenylyltransferase n=1 Tax=Durusdinium trenchii TaxID=1381693 RepID=A0ABP0JDV8_9DINO
MDVVKRRLDPRSYVKLVGSVEGCCVAPLAALWTSPPASVVRWDLAANAYPAPSGRKGPVVFAGSFNPPHHGHMEIIRYLSKAFSEVHIVIGMNPNKIYPVSPETRKQIIEQALPFIGAGNAKVWVWGDVIFKLAQHVGASALYRGIRSWEEDGKAERYLEVQNICWPMISTCGGPFGTYYVEAPPRYSFISSTLLRARLKSGESIDDIVPACVAEAVRQAYDGKL